MAIRESWEDYIPPYRNLGAIFIKAYNKKTSFRIIKLIFFTCCIHTSLTLLYEYCS